MREENAFFFNLILLLLERADKIYSSSFPNAYLWCRHESGTTLLISQSKSEFLFHVAKILSICFGGNSTNCTFASVFKEQTAHLCSDQSYCFLGEHKMKSNGCVSLQFYLG